MTEDEAKTKWCPFVRWAGSTDKPIDARAFGNNRGRIDKNQHNPHCIGSACMTWRWDETRNPDGSHVDKEYRDGWCGLAGK